MKTREALRNRSKKRMWERVTPYLHCKNVTIVPSGTGLLISEDCNGAYHNGIIHISNDEFGVALIDTLFHEDRHYIQDMSSKYNNRDYSIDYYIRPWEVDARRYAFVKTTRLLLRLRSATINPLKKLAFSITISKYTKYCRPW